MSAPAVSSAAAAPSSGVSPASAVAPAAASASGSGRNRRKRKNKQQTGSQQPAAHAYAHDGAHMHSHAHGAGGHTHGGVPCSGHGGSPVHGGPFGDASVSREDMSEAVHYCDVCWHYQSYRSHSFQRLERLQSDFAVMPTVLQQLVPTFEARMQRARQAVVANSVFVNEILAHRYVFHNTPEIDYEALEEKVAREHPIDAERMSRVRSTIRQCVRDWSVEGAAERATCYGPILSELERLYPTMDSRKDIRVLVPGSGLGRLVWECANRGFWATGNEFSYYMLMCSFLILNCCKATNVFTIFPYVHESKNLLDEEDALRSVQIPDVDPTSLPAQGHLSMAAGDWMDIFSDLPSSALHGLYQRKTEQARTRLRIFQEKQAQWSAERARREAATAAAKAAGLPAPVFPDLVVEEEQPLFVPDTQRTEGGRQNAETWDVFASCFFIDCATNVLEFLRTIAYVLKPGGYWINFGPLLYHYSDVENEVSVDLTWREIRRALPYFGFALLREELNQPSSYTLDDRSMLRQEYFCVSCTWQKVGEDWTSKPASARPALEEPKSVAWQSRMAGNAEYTTVAIDAGEPTLTKLLTVLLAKQLRETTSPSGAPITVWAIPAAKLGAFLMQAADRPGVALGKIVIESVEVLGALKKQ